MNIPLFIYKENEKEGKNKFVAILFFCALLVFTLFPFLYHIILPWYSL